MKILKRLALPVAGVGFLITSLTGCIGAIFGGSWQGSATTYYGAVDKGDTADGYTQMYFSIQCVNGSTGLTVTRTGPAVDVDNPPNWGSRWLTYTGCASTEYPVGSTFQIHKAP